MSTQDQLPPRPLQSAQAISSSSQYGPGTTSSRDSHETSHLSLRSLGRDTLIYGFGQVLWRIASILMLPIYTRFLTPSDYGILQLVQITLEIVAILLSAWVTPGVLRFYFKAQTDAERQGIVATALTMIAACSLCGTVLLLASAPWISRGILGLGTGPRLFRIAACTLFFDSVSSVPLILMQAQRRSVLYVASSVVKLAIQVALNLLFLVALGWGVEGILLSSLLANCAVGSALVIRTLRHTGLRIAGAALRDLYRFGLPYQMAAAGSFVLTFGDRYFLQTYHGVAAVGLYSLAYQFGFLLWYLSAEPFFLAWNPKRFQLAAERRELRDAEYNRGFRYLSLATITLAVVIAVTVRPVLALMAAPPFRAAADLVPFIMVAYVIQVWTHVVALGINVTERTMHATQATWISVGVILVSYRLFIPPLGPLGAALATVIGFAARLGYFLYVSQRLWPITYQWAFHLRLSLCAVAVAGVGLVLSPADLGPQIAIGLGLLLAYLVALWSMVLVPQDRHLISRALSARTVL